MLLLDLDTLDCAGPKAEGEAATANRPPRATTNCPPRAPPPPNPPAHIDVTTADGERVTATFAVPVCESSIEMPRQPHTGCVSQREVCVCATHAWQNSFLRRAFELYAGHRQPAGARRRHRTVDQ